MIILLFLATPAWSSSFFLRNSSVPTFFTSEEAPQQLVLSVHGTKIDKKAKLQQCFKGFNGNLTYFAVGEFNMLTAKWLKVEPPEEPHRRVELVQNILVIDNEVRQAAGSFTKMTLKQGRVNNIPAIISDPNVLKTAFDRNPKTALSLHQSCRIRDGWNTFSFTTLGKTESNLVAAQVNVPDISEVLMTLFINGVEHGFELTDVGSDKFQILIAEISPTAAHQVTNFTIAWSFNDHRDAKFAMVGNTRMSFSQACLDFKLVEVYTFKAKAKRSRRQALITLGVLAGTAIAGEGVSLYNQHENGKHIKNLEEAQHKLHEEELAKADFDRNALKDIQKLEVMIDHEDDTVKAGLRK